MQIEFQDNSSRPLLKIWWLQSPYTDILEQIDIIKYLVKSSNHYFIIVGDFSFYLLCQNFAEFQWVFSLL